jgi:hypothetical protein
MSWSADKVDAENSMADMKTAIATTGPNQMRAPLAHAKPLPLFE